MNSNEIVVSLSGVAISANKMQSKKRLEKNIIWESNELDRSKCQLKCKIRKKKETKKPTTNGEMIKRAISGLVTA